MSNPRFDSSRVIRSPIGSTLSCKSWLTEAAFRMIQNNLDPAVAENPQGLVVYGGIGRAARDWACFDTILAGRCIPLAPGRATCVAGQLQSGAALGDVGALQRTR